MIDRSTYPTRKLRLGDPEQDDPSLDAAERIGMVWQLTLQAWAFKGLDAVAVYARPRATGDLDLWTGRHETTLSACGLTSDGKRALGRPRDIADVAELEGGS